jgi:mRNA interferase RelE/StbE
MASTIEFEPVARRTLDKIHPTHRDRILRFLNDRIAPADDPRALGEALQGRLAGLWRYRVGDYRGVVRIAEGRAVVMVVDIGHLSAVYR